MTIKRSDFLAVTWIEISSYFLKVLYKWCFAHCHPKKCTQPLNTLKWITNKHALQPWAVTHLTTLQGGKLLQQTTSSHIWEKGNNRYKHKTRASLLLLHFEHLTQHNPILRQWFIMSALLLLTNYNIDGFFFLQILTLRKYKNCIYGIL